ncbi:MAG: HAD family phosphatase [Clostridia bacterium]|nr:HAD family phosphatase [Clostridia bacterium]MBR1686369.1 HAD family phosphatase [Clostridia bacterium]
MKTAVLFDLDGVLTDTERSGMTMLNLACAKQGFQLTEAHWLQLVGATLDKTKQQLKAWFLAVNEQRLVADWTATTLAYTKEHGVPEKEGAREVLTLLRSSGYKLAVCTSNSRLVVQSYLSQLGWTHLFDTLVTSEDVLHRKPAPDTYLLAAKRLQVTPDRCVGVEDSPGGLQAVKAAGMYTVWIPDLIPVNDPTAYDVSLRSLSDLPKLLSHL